MYSSKRATESEDTSMIYKVIYRDNLGKGKEYVYADNAHEVRKEFERFYGDLLKAIKVRKINIFDRIYLKKTCYMPVLDL